MKVSYKWLKKFLPALDATPETVADTLTFLGLEVEKVEHLDDDFILDVEVTTNRPDCLSILGVARELSAKLGIPLILPDVKLMHSEKANSDFTSVEVEEPELCPRYIARLILGVEVKESPEWMKKSLIGIGVRPVNNVVDATNYVGMELGEPLHAFDLDKLIERRIVVRCAREGEEIRAIDGRIYPLKEDMLVIADGKFPVAIAGVMGGKDTEVTEETKNILLEAAYFDPVSVRRTSKRLSLITAASFRFSRGVDYDIVPLASDYAASLIQRLAGGEVLDRPIDVAEGGFEPREMSMRFARIKTVMGIDITPEEAERTLNALGFRTVEKNDKRITVEVPPRRRDVEEEVHLIEEVARIHGFDDIPIVTQPVAVTELVREQEVLRSVRSFVSAAGFYEVMSDVFVPADGVLSGYSFITETPPLKVRNPLRADEPALRKSLIPNLLKIYSFNQNYAGRSPELFEVSKVFLDTGEKLPYEPHLLTLLTPKGYERAKGVIEALFERLGLNISFTESETPILQKACSAKILFNEETLGVIGMLEPTLKELTSIRDPLFVAELNLSSVVLSVPLVRRYEPIPKTPEILRDIAIVVDEQLLWREVETEIKSVSVPNLRSVTLFDTYRGRQIPKGKKSLAIRFRFYDPQRTLLSEEVEEALKAVVSRLREKFGALIRGVDIR